MLNTFVRLFLVVAAVLLVIAILHVVIPLVFTAAVAAAIILGILFLINLFRRNRRALP